MHNKMFLIFRLFLIIFTRQTVHSEHWNACKYKLSHIQLE